MPHRIRILPKILLALGCVALFLLIKYQGALKEVVAHGGDAFSIVVDNFFFDMGAGVTRHRPISLEQKETELKLYIGDPFRSFEPQDWGDFWDLIYGGFLKVDPQRPDLPRKKRQLTEDEIADVLIEQYPTPFLLFQKSHWQSLFGIIFKK